MRTYIAARINTGKAVHIAKSFETVSGVKGFDINCGSNNSGWRTRVHKISDVVTKETITCKKCLNMLEQQEQEQANEQQVNEQPVKEVDTNSQEYKIAKLKEFATNEESEELQELAALKNAFENKETFVLTK